MKFKRRKLREKVLQILYANEMNNDDLADIIEEQLNDIKKETDKEFVDRTVHNVIANKNKLNEIIKKRLVNWDVSRIAVIDKLLLQIGIAELLFAEDIPTKVTINETIEIAKEYSTAKSGKFINGILDAVLLELKKDGKIKKAGRGLIENTLPKKSKKG